MRFILSPLPHYDLFKVTTNLPFHMHSPFTMLQSQTYVGFHTEGRMPWDFPPQALLTLLYTLYYFPAPNGIRSSVCLSQKQWFCMKHCSMWQKIGAAGGEWREPHLIVITWTQLHNCKWSVDLLWSNLIGQNVTTVIQVHINIALAWTTKWSGIYPKLLHYFSQ